MRGVFALRIRAMSYPGVLSMKETRRWATAPYGGIVPRPRPPERRGCPPQGTPKRRRPRQGLVLPRGQRPSIPAGGEQSRFGVWIEPVVPDQRADARELPVVDSVMRYRVSRSPNISYDTSFNSRLGSLLTETVANDPILLHWLLQVANARSMPMTAVLFWRRAVWKDGIITFGIERPKKLSEKKNKGQALYSCSSF